MTRFRTLTFQIGDAVRYRPGVGTYGLEDSTERDGRVPAVVIGLTAQRVRVRLTLGGQRTGNTLDRAVDAASLVGVRP